MNRFSQAVQAISVMSITAMSMRTLVSLFLVQKPDDSLMTGRAFTPCNNFDTAVRPSTMNVSLISSATGLNAVLSIGKAFTASERMVSHVSRNDLRITGSYC